MKYQRWTVAQGGQQARETLEQAGLSPLLSAVLAARGVETPEQAAKLFAPEWEPLADPMAMADMDKETRDLLLYAVRQLFVSKAQVKQEERNEKRRKKEKKEEEK